MIIKNVSGGTLYFGFTGGVRGRSMANNGVSTIPDYNPITQGQVARYVQQGKLQVVDSPAYAFVELNGAIADAARVTVLGTVFEFEATVPTGSVAGYYNTGLSNVAYLWAGLPAAADVAAGTLRTAINNNPTLGVTADAPVQYETGKYILPIRRTDGGTTALAGTMAVTGSNLVISAAAMTAGYANASVRSVSKQITVVAADVTATSILVVTGLTSIATAAVQVLRLGVRLAWDGATVVSGGSVTLNNVGSVDWAAADVITVTVTGSP